MTVVTRAACISLLFLFSFDASARSVVQPDRHHVDLVLALDVSGSMSGLIDSAKQRLWEVVNEVGQAESAPTLRVALVTFGNPTYGVEGGYVRLDQPFTRDLDSLNKALFSLGTNGGDEYVARAVTRAIAELDWNKSDNSARIVFVAGNEGAAQDPLVTPSQMAALVKQHGVALTTIYCGSANDSAATSWAHAAQITGGMYASIDQQAASVAQIETPMDAELTALNQKLNETYIAYGEQGEERSNNQMEQDKNAAKMSPEAAVSRAVTKAGGLYRNESWDLVDAVESGKDVASIPDEQLPASLQAMTVKEREVAVKSKVEERQQIKQRISKLGQSRSDYIRENKQIDEDKLGLDTVMKRTLEKSMKQASIEQ